MEPWYLQQRHGFTDFHNRSAGLFEILLSHFHIALFFQRYPALGSTAKGIIPPKVVNKLLNDTKTNFASSLYHGLESFVVGLHEEMVRLQMVEDSTPESSTASQDGKKEDESNIALVLGLTFLILVLLIISIFCIIFLVRWRRNRSQSYEPGQERDVVKRSPDAEAGAEERRSPDEVDEDEENNNQEAQEVERRSKRTWLQPMTSGIRDSWTRVKAISFKKKRTSGDEERVQEYQAVETTEVRTAPKATEEEDEDEFAVPEGTSGTEAVEGDPKVVPVYAETTQPLQKPPTESNL